MNSLNRDFLFCVVDDDMSFTVGFIVNPIAGMGGRVGLKGTDGVVEEAIERGALPVAPGKATEALQEYMEKYHDDDVRWMTCAGMMGEKIFKKVGLHSFDVVYKPSGEKTTALDTKEACRIFREKQVDLLLFCGGDGTARDVVEVVGSEIPVLGIPAGVKMHSGVFAITPRVVAKMIHEFVHQRLTVGDAEIMDLDEEKYRRGEWNIKLFGIAKGIIEPTYIQVGKASFESVSENEVRDELADHIQDEMKKYQDYLFLFGSGGTIDYIAKKLGISNTLLGVDAVYQGETIARDLNEKEILTLLEKYSKAKIILSPIGAQGFILGRGNLQLSPNVIRRVDLDDIIVISTPSKLASIPFIRVDTGDKELDQRFAEKEFMMVVIGYRMSRVMRIQTNNF